MSNTTHRIGLLFAHNFGYYRYVLRGIRRFVEAKPNWLFVSLDPSQRSLRIPRRLRLDGLIAAVNTKPVLAAVSASRRPLVNLSVMFPGLRFPCVYVDNAQVGRLAVAHFLERGLRRFAFIGPADYVYSIQRREAFLSAVQAAGYTAACYESSRSLEYDPFGYRWDLEPKAQRWLRALPKPVGIFISDEIWCMQAADACRLAGLRVPEDVALLGVGNDDVYCELSRPPLSSIILPTEQIGYEAASLLDRLLQGEKPPREPLLLSPVGVATRRSSEVLAIDDLDVVAAVRYIREHSHLPLRVSDVLRQVSAGRRTLERRCRAALGWGIGQEIRRTHLERARRLLANTDLPMKVLASQAGFSDYCQMAVAFRREVGLSPTGYRRQTRNPIGKSAP